MRLRKQQRADDAARELRAAAQENFEERQRRMMTMKQQIGAQEEPPWATSNNGKGQGLEEELEKKVSQGNEGNGHSKEMKLRSQCSCLFYGMILLKAYLHNEVMYISQWWKQPIRNFEKLGR